MERAICYCFGKNFIEQFDRISKRYDIVALTDSDSNKIGREYKGVVCVSNDEAFSMDADIVFIASDRPEIVTAVKHMLIEKGIELPIESILENLNTRLEITGHTGAYEWEDVSENRLYALSGSCINKLNVYFRGNSNRIVLDENVTIRDILKIEIYGDNNYVHIGKNTSICDLAIILGEGGSVCIGESCLFASEIMIRQTDGHPIFDQNGERINKGKNVNIGNHVWVGDRASVLGGFNIGNESVVGYGTVSSSCFGDNCIIAGNPARIVRENIIWKDNLLGLYEIDNIRDLRI